MTPRNCESCGRRMAPHWPRKRLFDGRLGCPSCQQRERYTMTTAASYSSDEHEQHALFGCYHHALGRALKNAPHLAKGVAPLSEDEQEERLTGALWKPPVKPFEPVHHVIEGARGYASKVGLPDPHPHGFHHVMRTPDDVREIGRAYQGLPHHDQAAVPHYQSLLREVNHQFDHMTKTMGIKFEPVEHDPYKSGREMAEDVTKNKRIQVLKTSVTGGHPFFSDDDNDKFRAVHDVFGHAATGRSFDKHGEEAAWVAHSQMFSPHARRALTTETRGQNSFYNLNGKFADQKVALLPEHHADHTGYLLGGKTAAAEEGLPSGTTDDIKKWLPHLHHMVTDHGITTGQAIHLLHAGGHIMPLVHDQHQDLQQLAQTTRGLQAIHHDMHGGDYSSHAGHGIGHRHDLDDPLVSRAHPKPFDETPYQDKTKLWGAGPVGDFSRQKNYTGDLHPDRPEHLPNLKIHDDPSKPHEWSNLSGCSKVHRADTSDDSKCEECGAYKWMHAEHRPSEEGKVKPYIYEDRGTDFLRREKAPFQPLKPSLNSLSTPAEDLPKKGRQTMQVVARRLSTMVEPDDVWTPQSRLPLHAFLAADKPDLIVVAHDSGDGETIFHCPFCGSGQVIARSDGTVECEFCTTSFTVQVQPQMNAMPQTIDGVPVDIPGMPNGGDTAMVPPEQGGPVDEDGDGVPDEEEGGEEPPEEDSGGGGNPFAKGSARYYLTAQGVALDEDSYLRHLAIKHAANRLAVIEQVRAERQH